MILGVGRISQYVIGVNIDEFFTSPRWVVHPLFFQGLPNILGLDNQYSLLRREVAEPTTKYFWERGQVACNSCSGSDEGSVFGLRLTYNGSTVDLAYDNMTRERKKATRPS
jgi:hypothetical protein